jgi:hypothetical protein
MGAVVTTPAGDCARQLPLKKHASTAYVLGIHWRGMAKIKVRRERTVHLRPHNDLRQAAAHHKQRADERFAAGDLRGIAYDTLAAMVLLAFAVEAQVNFFGHRLIPGWEERAPLDKKMKQVLKQLKIVPDWNKRPYSTIRLLKAELRDVLAHGKPSTKEVDEVVIMEQNDPEDLSFEHLQSAWAPYCRGDFYLQAFADAEAVWEAMFVASGLREFDALTQSSGAFITSNTRPITRRSRVAPIRFTNHAARLMVMRSTIGSAPSAN